jgi:hypothetical protein
LKLIILFLIFVCPNAKAQMGNTGLTHGHNATIHGPDATPAPIKNKVFGQCTIIAGNGNMLGGPCTNLVLSLQPGKNKEIQNTRTTATGYFEFNAPLSESYKIGVSSKLYEVVSPSENVQSGESIDLKLRQK